MRHHIWKIETFHLRGQATPSRATGHQRQWSPTTEGPPRTIARTSPSQNGGAQPPAIGPRYAAQQSPLRPFANRPPDHDNQHVPRMETRQRSPQTPEQCQGTRWTTGARSQNRTPLPMARRVIFCDDASSSSGRPSGGQPGQGHPRPNPNGPKGPERIRCKSPPCSWRRSTCTLQQQRALHPANPLPPPLRDRAALYQGHTTPQGTPCGDEQAALTTEQAPRTPLCSGPTATQ